MGQETGQEIGQETGTGDRRQDGTPCDTTDVVSHVPLHVPGQLASHKAWNGLKKASCPPGPRRCLRLPRWPSDFPVSVLPSPPCQRFAAAVRRVLSDPLPRPSNLLSPRALIKLSSELCIHSWNTPSQAISTTVSLQKLNLKKRIQPLKL